MPIRTSALRTLGGYFNAVSAEMFIDELAAMSGRDPVAFRLANVKDPRLDAVLKKAVEMSGWKPAVVAQRPLAPEMVGTGVGLSRYKNGDAYVAVVAEVSVEHQQRCGPAAQACGARPMPDAPSIPTACSTRSTAAWSQATSWTLQEAGRWDSGIMTAVDYGAYPISGFRHDAGHAFGGDRPARSAVAGCRRGQPGARRRGHRQRGLCSDRPARCRDTLHAGACARRPARVTVGFSLPHLLHGESDCLEGQVIWHD